MSEIKIPPEVLEAGAKAIAVDGGIADPEWRFYKEAARAAFLAMLEAWPDARERPYWDLMTNTRHIEIILPEA